MAAKKATSKQRARASAPRRKAATRGSSSRKKSTGKKSKVSKKSATPRKAATKAAGRKKATAARKPARKSTAAAKSRSRAVSKSRTANRKSASVAKHRAIPKPAAKKKVTSSRPTTPKTSGRVATATKSRSRADLLAGPIHGIEPYVAKRGENYMSKEQLAHFRAILTSWKRELMNEVDRTVHHMQDEAANFPDPNDRATQESEFGLELRTRDRERKLLRKINAAIARDVSQAIDIFFSIEPHLHDN